MPIGWQRVRHPAGRDHDRQALRQVAQDLERRAAGPDDHRGPELGDRDAVGRQLGARLVAAGEVVREVRRVVAEAAQVDDPRHARVLRRLREVAGRLPVPLREPPFAGSHRVGQVVGDLDPLERRGQCRCGRGGRRRRPWPPGTGPRGAGRRGSAGRGRGPGLEQRDQATADVAAGADDEDAHATSMR